MIAKLQQAKVQPATLEAIYLDSSSNGQNGAITGYAMLDKNVRASTRKTNPGLEISCFVVTSSYGSIETQYDIEILFTYKSTKTKI